MDHQLMLCPAQRRARGFTLIEIVVVLAVIGILAAIAFPSYQESIRKSNRASAKEVMTQVAGRLAPHYSDNGSYTVTLTELGYPSSTLKSKAGKHLVTVVAGSSGIASSYTIKATHVSETADPSCSPLTLDHLGVMGPAGC